MWNLWRAGPCAPCNLCCLRGWDLPPGMKVAQSSGKKSGHQIHKEAGEDVGWEAEVARTEPWGPLTIFQHLLQSLPSLSGPFGNHDLCKGLRFLLWKAHVCSTEHLGSPELQAQTQDLTRDFNVTSLGFKITRVTDTEQGLFSFMGLWPFCFMPALLSPDLELPSYVSPGTWIMAFIFPGSVTVGLCVHTASSYLPYRVASL